MASQEAVSVLDDLLDTLERAGAGSPDVSRTPSRTGVIHGDAIEHELQSPARTTQARSLRDAPEIIAFREALVDGLIRVDTANRLLSLIDQVVTRLLMPV